MFTQDDAHGLSGTIGVLYAAQSRPEVVQAMMTAMNQRFQLVATTCEEFSSDTSFYMVHGLRTAVPAVPDHAAYIHDNPLVVPLSRAGATPVMQLRQQVSLAQWKGTDHYNGIARVSGIHDQLVIIARSAPSMVTVGLFRDAVFSGPERALNRLLQPHLAAAWQRVHQTEPSPAFTRSLRITLSPELRPLQLSVAAGQVFRDYFPRARNGGALPDTVQGWLLHALAELRSKPPTRPLRALTVEMERSRRDGTSLVVALVDLDFFKRLNDTYGHLAGDETLCWFAAAVGGAIRPYDHGGRYGGEEFVAVLSSTSAQDAALIAERIRTEVQRYEGAARYKVSIGIASTDAQGSDSLALLIQQADRALYRAKQHGRDRIEMAL